MAAGEEADAANGEQLDAWANDEGVPEEDEEELDEDEGWDLDAEVVDTGAAEEEGEDILAAGEADLSEGVAPGVDEDEMWVRNSPLAADHAAAGNFESAMQLLNRQVAAVDFAPLKPLFLQAYRAAHTYVPANASLPPLEFHVRRNPETTELREVLPAIALDFEDLKEKELAAALKAFSRGKFADALVMFRDILQKLLLTVVTTEEAATEVKELVKTAREYVIGLRLETERRRLVAEEPDNVVRNLELAAYFTHCALQPQHVQLALRSAMNTFFKAGNVATAAVFARRFIDTNPGEPRAVTQARSILAQGDRNPRDAHEVAYDQFTTFTVCPASLTPIYQGSPAAVAAYTGARYLPEYQNTVCVIDEVTQVGLPASGMRSIV
jgi:coatomer protein complex subunit alpha (xenin)